MQGINKIALAASFLACSSVHAAAFEPACVPGNVTVPCASSGWDLGIQALYLQNRMNGFYEAYVGSVNQNGVRHLNEEKGSWGLGFKLEASYHYKTGQDFNLNWYHWSKQNNFTTQGDALGQVPVYFQFNNIKPEWDAVNAELGQQIDSGAVHTRLHLGAQLARLKRHVHTTWSDLLPPTDFFNDSTQKFTGIGPRVGVDIRSEVIDDFSVYSNIAASALLGNSDFVDASSSSPGSSSRFAVVPEFEIKAGVKYKKVMQNGTLTIDGGYMVVNYFSSFNTYISGAQPSGDRVSTDSVSDFAMHGPYLGAHWVSKAIN